MGDRNQRRWIGSLRDALPAPYLEAGARDWGSGQDLRSLFPGAEWVGADLAPGPGVDVVMDLAAPFDAVDRALGRRRFGTVLCLSVLEHCARPFEVAANLTRLLAPGGRLAVSVPFAWKVHSFPGDYWRFTPDGVRLLFPGIDFDGVPARATTDRPGDGVPAGNDLGLVPLHGGAHRRGGRYVRGLSADALRLLAKVGPLRWLAGHRYLLAPTMVHMLGTRRDGR